MRTSVPRERGSATVIALMIIVVMLSIGLGTFTFVGAQQKASGDERVRDSSYNLAEAALESAVQYLTVSPWPDSGLGGKPQPWGHKPADANGVGGTCTQSSTTGVGGDNCPDPASVTGTFNTSSTEPDYGGSPTWTTKVLDNASPSATFYRESSTGTQAFFDNNNDKTVWVRAEATVMGKKRILVALVRRAQGAATQRAVMWAGQIQVLTATNGVVIDTQGTATYPAKIILPTGGTSGGGSIGADANKGQIQPWTETDAGNGSLSATSVGNKCVTEAGAVSPGAPYCFSSNSGATAIALRTKAQGIPGAYFAYGTCPTLAQMAQPFIYIEGKVGGCSYLSGSNVWNSAASPGMIVMGKFNDGDDLWIGGNNTFYGLIYDANEAVTNDFLHVYITNTAQVVGAIVTEWGSGIYIDSTRSPALKYDPNVFTSIDLAGGTGASSTGTPGIVQGSYREVPSGS